MLITLLAGVAFVIAITVSVFKYFDAAERPTRVTNTIWWVMAGFVLADVAVWYLNWDEVYWLANTWAIQHGEASFTMPLRYFPFLPYLWLHLSPSTTLLLGRMVVLTMAIGVSILVGKTASRFDSDSRVGGLIGALCLIALAHDTKMISLKAEYYACFLMAIGCWLLLAPPQRLKAEYSLMLGLFAISLAGGTSLRQSLYVPAAIVAVLIEPPIRSRLRAFLWSSLGALIVLLPSLGYLLTRTSISGFVTSTLSSISIGGMEEMTSPLPLPYILMLLAAGGLAFLNLSRSPLPGARRLLVLWLVAILFRLFLPLPAYYASGPFLILNFISLAGFWGGWKGRKIGSLPWYRASFAILALHLIVRPAMHMSENAALPLQLRIQKSQFGLMDWLHDTAGAGKVMCVCPYHPIMSSNACCWDATAYYGVHNLEANRSIYADYEKTLLSGEPAVIQWDPWPKFSGYPNILVHAVDAGLIDDDRAHQAAEYLQDHYQFVRWKPPLHSRFFGGGAYLVRKDIEVSGPVEILEGTALLSWRDAK